MRHAPAVVSLGLVLGMLAPALAQDLVGPRTTPSSAASTYPRTMTGDQLRFERALERARQRTARIEAHRWAGVSPQRPSTGFHASSGRDLNPAYAIWGWGVHAHTNASGW